MNMFTEHPQSQGLTYLQHAKVAVAYASEFLFIFVALIVHSVFPFLFTTTASKGIVKLYEDVVYHDNRTNLQEILAHNSQLVNENKELRQQIARLLKNEYS